MDSRKTVAKPKPKMSDLFGEGAVPEKPTERSQKSLSGSGPTTQPQSIPNEDAYIEFNKALFACIDDLEKKLKDKKKFALVRKTISKYIKKDITKPMTIWIESVGDNDHVLRTLNAENEALFLKIAPKISILSILEITENWQLFSPKEKKILWAHFAAMFQHSDWVQSVDDETMIQVKYVSDQLEALGLNSSMLDEMDALTAFQKVDAVINATPELKEIANQINARYAPQFKPDPPTYSKARAAALDD